MLNIKVIHSGELLTIKPQDSGFSHGFALFETLRVEDGKLFFWARHWKRLERSAQAFKLDSFLNGQEASVLKAIRSLNAQHEVSSYALKLSLMPASEGATLYLYIRDFEIIGQQIRIALNTVHPINEKAPLAGHKTHNYLENILLLEEARSKGFNDYLRVDTQMRVSETCIGNIFFIIGGLIKTPSIASGVLPGVIREVLLESGIIESVEMTQGDLVSLEAAFMTNSLRHISLVSEIHTDQGAIIFKNTAVSDRLIERIEDYLVSAQKTESVNLSLS